MGMRYFRCPREYGDRCNYAVENRTISEQEALDPLESGGKFRCPGRRESGNPCLEELIEIPPPGTSYRRKLVLAGGALAVVVLLGLVLSQTTGFFHWNIFGTPELHVEPDVLIFPKAKKGAATVDLTVRNTGDGTLELTGTEPLPAGFSVSELPDKVEANSSVTLRVNFQSGTEALVEGTLVLHSNAKNTVPPVKLIANRDPWWVYDKLGESSKILDGRP